MDCKIIDFANKYDHDQEQINLKITYITQNLIIPVTLEHENLKEELQTAYKQINQLKVFDTAAQNKNRIKKMKKWMEIQKEELNLNNNDINKSMKNSQSAQNKDREKKRKTAGLIMQQVYHIIKKIFYDVIHLLDYEH